MPPLSRLLPDSTSRRLALSIFLLVGMTLASVAALTARQWQFQRTIAGFVANDLQRATLLSEINAQANLSSRKLLVLLVSAREARVAAYTEIDEAARRLDAAMARLPALLEGAAANPGYEGIVQALSHYRGSFGETADLIEAEDHEAARQSIQASTEVALSALIAATQELNQGEQRQLGQRTKALHAELERDFRASLAMGALMLCAAGALAWWVARRVAEPLRRAGAMAQRIADGDYAARLPEGRPGDEVHELAAALNRLAAGVQAREAELRRLIDIDGLTGLPQRNHFLLSQAATAVQAAREAADGNTRSGWALLCFDLERLKSINALLGFDAGDAAIRGMAARAEQRAGTGRVARLGGGTFAVLVPAAAAADALAAAATFQREMEHRSSWRDHEFDLSIAVGAAHVPTHGETLPEVLRRAEQALYDTKRRHSRLAVYSPAIEAERLSHLSLLSELERGVAGGELVPFLQAKHCLRSGRVVGAEALVRWKHPERGWVSPAEFIPFAERSGRIAMITRSMLRQAIALLAGPLPAAMYVAVNISTHDLRDDRLPAELGAWLRHGGVDPSRLQLEVTESGLLDSGDEPVQRLRELRATGVQLAIDDFGTGQSSLAYLQQLPVHELKIDRSFVSQANADPRRAALLASIIRLAQGLDLIVTAEGVETAAELGLLKELGCDLAQGYLLARPQPVDAFVEQWVAPA